MKDKDLKTLIENFITNKVTVKGTALKKSVVFNYANRRESTNMLNPTPSNLSYNFNAPSEDVREIPVAKSENPNRFLLTQSQSQNQSQIQFDNIEKSPEAKQEDVPNQRQFSSNNPNPTDKLVEKQVQDLKIEYYKFKNQLSNLIETNKNLKNKVDIEKSRGGDINTNINSQNCNYNLILN